MRGAGLFDVVGVRPYVSLGAGGGARADGGVAEREVVLILLGLIYDVLHDLLLLLASG